MKFTKEDAIITTSENHSIMLAICFKQLYAVNMLNSPLSGLIV